MTEGMNRRFTVIVGREQVMAPYTRHEVWAGSFGALDRFNWMAERESHPGYEGNPG